MDIRGPRWTPIIGEIGSPTKKISSKKKKKKKRFSHIINTQVI